MRILKSPITHDGHVRYFELFKILVLVTASVMSFSYGFMAVNPLLSMIRNMYGFFMGMVFLVSFVMALYFDVKELLQLLKSFVVPWLDHVISHTLNMLETHVKTIYIPLSQTIEKADFNTICVMRC